MIAVIQTGGKQYVVQPGDVLKIEKIPGNAGDKVAFDTLLTADSEQVSVGAPVLTAKTTAEVVEQGVGKKIEVVHYKPKVRYTRRRGHRQLYTKVKIVDVTTTS